MIYQDKYDRIVKACRQITSHRQALAKPALEELLLGRIDPEVANEDLLAHLIAEALMRRIDRQLVESKNIFVQGFDIPQITLFYSMAEAVPFVYAGHSAANQFLLREAAALSRFTLFDIGIGNGRQAVRLLQALTGRRRPEAVTVVGLDPVSNNLEQAREAIEAAGADLPFAVEFRPMLGMLESIDPGELRGVTRLPGDGLLINSAFTLHHTMHPIGDCTLRTDLIARLAELQPRALALVEPSSNHDTEQLAKRVHHSWEHFGHVFALIDEAQIDERHKYLIKEKFFGREIRDIFGVSDYFRCERHELYDSWLLRFHKAGFQPLPHADLCVELPDYCSHVVSDGLVRFNYRDVTIVAAMGFSPR